MIFPISTKQFCRATAPENTSTVMSPSSNHANLSSMPIELTEMILKWVQHLPPIHQIHQNQQTCTTRYVGGDRPLRKFQETSHDLHLSDIRLLASVNRSFYQILSPYIFHSFDFRGFTVDRLNFTLEEIIKRHSHHVRNIRWEISDYNEYLEARKEPLNANKYYNHPYWISQWDSKLRSEVLLKILESCPHLTDLNIELDPKSFIPTKNVFTSKSLLNSSTSSDNQMPNLFIKPISQFTSLTHLSLSCPDPQPAHTESFIVDILSNLPQLQSFGCTSVGATDHTPFDNQQACQSPLGIHLASLTHLVELQLEWLEHWDASWNQLDWKSPLEALYLSNAYDVSVSVLHGFCRLFKSTLKTLILVIFIDDPNALDPEFIPNDSFRFELPRLTDLRIISNWAIQYSKAFRGLKSLSRLSLGLDPLYDTQELENSIQDQLWPNLKKLEIEDHHSPHVYSDVVGLEDLCQSYQIEIFFVCGLDDEDG